MNRPWKLSFVPPLPHTRLKPPPHSVSILAQGVLRFFSCPLEAGTPAASVRLHGAPHLPHRNVVHVSRTDFLIGRGPLVANLTLDSPLVLDMVSRRHARIVSSDDGMPHGASGLGRSKDGVIDCASSQRFGLPVARCGAKFADRSCHTTSICPTLRSAFEVCTLSTASRSTVRG